MYHYSDLTHPQGAAGAERAKGARQADELPLLLIAAGEWTELVRTLTLPAVFLALYNKRRKFELIAYVASAKWSVYSMCLHCVCAFVCMCV